MPGVEKHSEFDGGGVMPNTVFPKGSDALTPADKLRLQSLTGQEEDSQAPLDPYFWNGNVRPDETSARQVQLERRERERRLQRGEILRYRESPY